MLLRYPLAILLSALLFSTLSASEKLMMIPNDECSSAEAITVIEGSTSTISFNTGDATNSINPAGSCNSVVQHDAWYSFSSPVNGNLYFNFNSSTVNLVAYDGCNGNELECLNNDGFLYNVSINDPIIIRISRPASSPGNVIVEIDAFTSLSNDECASAESISVLEGSTTTISFNTRAVSPSSNPEGTCLSTPQNDAWFSFFSPVNGNLFFNFNSSLVNLVAYDGCSGNELTCITNDGFLYNVSINDPIIIRISRPAYSPANATVDIDAYTSLSNDECSNPEFISISEGSTTSVSFNTSAVSPSSNPEGTCLSTPQNDAWFSFSSPVNGNLFFNFNSSLVNLVAYDGCSGNELTCITNDGFLYNVSLADRIILRISRPAHSPANAIVEIDAYTSLSNDECSNPEFISISEGSTTTLSFNTSAVSPSSNPEGTCLSTPQNDAWYSFSSPVNGNLFFNFNSSLINLVAYDGCSGNELTCITNDGFLYNVSLADRIILRISRPAHSPANAIVEIDAYTSLSNDECSNPEFISISEGSTTTVSFNTSAVSPSNNPEGTCLSTPQNDAWYSFSSPVNGNLYFEFSSSIINLVAYDGCSGNELVCINNDGFIYNVSLGDRIILRISRPASSPAIAAVEIDAFTFLSNDDCNTAEEINVAALTKCNEENNTFQLAAASIDIENPSCHSGSAPSGAWFYFESPITGSISLNTNSSLNKFAIYDACGGNEIACFNNDGTIPGVVFGQTYYVQIFRSSHMPAQVTFCLEGSYDVSQGDPGICESALDVTIDASNNNEWVPILNGNDEIIAAIDANGNNLGTVSTSVFVDLNDTRSQSGKPYLRRNVEINPTNAPTSLVAVRIYLLEDEFDDLAAVDPALSNITGLEMMKLTTTACDEPLDGTGDFINVAGRSYNTFDYYLQFNVSSFSNFYPSSQNQFLPVELIEFSGTPYPEYTMLNWSTASELNSDRFIIERKDENNNDWTPIGTVQAQGNSSSIIHYDYKDHLLVSQAYYRIKIIDIDGSFEYSHIIIMNRSVSTESLQVFPNPATQHVFIGSSDHEIILYDGHGNMINTLKADSNNDISALAPGMYLIQSGADVKRLIKH